MLPAAVNGLLKELLPEELLVDANSGLATFKEGFRLFGPLVGAAIFATAGGWLVAVVDAATFVVAAAFIASIRVTETAAPPRTGFRDEVMAGLRFIVGDRVLRNVLIGLGASILVIGFFEASIYALLDAFDKAPTFAGVFVTLQGVGAIAGGLTASLVVRRLGEVGGAVVGLATMALSTAIVASAPNMSVVLGGAVLLGIAIPWTFVAFTTLMQRRSPSHLIGRVSATVDVLLSTPQAISLAVGSLLVSLLDYRTIFWIIAVVMTLGALQIATTLRDQIRADLRQRRHAGGAGPGSRRRTSQSARTCSRRPVTVVQLGVAHALPSPHGHSCSRDRRSPFGRRRPASGPREGDHRGHPGALRRARRPRRPDRGHRPRRRHQPGHRLPALLRQGGAVRAHPGELSRRAARGPRVGRRP